MKKLLFISFLIASFSLDSRSQEYDFPHFTSGVEWGYDATFHKLWHYNFFSPEGYRVNQSENTFFYKNNAEAYLNAGYNIDHNWNISLYLGIAGLGDLHKAIPISLRGTYYWDDNPLNDRWFTFIDLGSGISWKRPVQEIFSGKAGGGYRMSLSRDVKLDFLLAFKATYTHSDIIYDDVRIDSERINRNDMLLSAIYLGMAINF